MSRAAIKCRFGRADKILDFGYDVIMYSNNEKQRTIELFYHNHRSWSSVVRELGYPSLGALKRWIKDYEENNKSILEDKPRTRKPKYFSDQRIQAVDHYFEHGQFITKTVKALGYPSRQLLREWLLEDPRCDKDLRNRTFVAKKQNSDKIKDGAVEALYKRSKSAEQIADDIGVSRQTLYNWKQDRLGKNFPAKNDSASELHPQSLSENQDVAKLQAKIAELELQNDILMQVNTL